MDNPQLIYPGDRVFLAIPPNLERQPEDVAVMLDETYPGVDFEVTECADLVRPQVIFTYRDPRALPTWLSEQPINEASQVVGLTEQPVRRFTGFRTPPPTIG